MTKEELLDGEEYDTIPTALNLLIKNNQLLGTILEILVKKNGIEDSEVHKMLEKHLDEALKLVKPPSN
jgi:hypothetical protein